MTIAGNNGYIDKVNCFTLQKYFVVPGETLGC